MHYEPYLSLFLTIGMAVITRLAVVDIAAYPLMFVIHVGLIVLMTVYTAKATEVATDMTVCAYIPLSIVFATVDGEVIVVVIKSRWRPRIRGMTVFTCRGISLRLMRRIRGVVIVVHVAAIALGGQGVVVIPLMTIVAIDCEVRSSELEEIVVLWKLRRCPTRIGRMACLAIRSDI